MLENLKKNRSALIQGAAMALVLLFIFSAYNVLQHVGRRVVADFSYPYMFLRRATADSLSDLNLLGFSKLELARQLEDLAAKNRHLQAQALQAGELWEENLNLRKLLALNAPAGWDYIGCEIIYRDVWFWSESLTIDKGSNAGLKIGDAALSVNTDGQLSFLGVVRELGNHHAQIYTVYNPELKMSVRLPRTGVSGILNADDEHPVRGGGVPVGFLPVKAKYQNAEIAVTTGYERGIPPGIRIGNLQLPENSASPYLNESYLAGILVPSLEMNDLRFIVIASRRNDEASGQ